MEQEKTKIAELTDRELQEAIFKMLKSIEYNTHNLDNNTRRTARDLNWITGVILIGIILSVLAALFARH